jgi:hypothetical protein
MDRNQPTAGAKLIWIESMSLSLIAHDLVGSRLL